MNSSLPFEFEIDVNPTFSKSGEKFSPDEVYELTNFEPNGRQSRLTRSVFNFDFTSKLLGPMSENEVMRQTGLSHVAKVRSLRAYFKQIIDSLNLSSDETVEINYLRGTIGTH